MLCGKDKGIEILFLFSFGGRHVHILVLGTKGCTGSRRFGDLGVANFSLGTSKISSFAMSILLRAGMMKDGHMMKCH